MKGELFDKYNMPVVSGASGQNIAASLADILNMDHVIMEDRRFPDGEGYVRLPNEKIESVHISINLFQFDTSKHQYCL